MRTLFRRGCLLFFLVNLGLSAWLYWRYHRLATFGDLSPTARLARAREYFDFSPPPGFEIEFAGEVLGKRTLTLRGGGCLLDCESVAGPLTGRHFRETLSASATVRTQAILDRFAALPDPERMPLPLLREIQEYSELAVGAAGELPTPWGGVRYCFFSGTRDDGTVRSRLFAQSITKGPAGFSLIGSEVGRSDNGSLLKFLATLHPRE